MFEQDLSNQNYASHCSRLLTGNDTLHTELALTDLRYVSQVGISTQISQVYVFYTCSENLVLACEKLATGTYLYTVAIVCFR